MPDRTVPGLRDRFVVARELGLAGLLVVALVGPLPGFGSVAWADARADARRLYREGMTAIHQGRHDEGIARLQRAYEILPHANVLYNIARAYAEVGEYESSIAYFERYLDLEPPDAETVRGFVQSMRDLLALREAPPQESQEPEVVESVATTETPEATAEDAATVEEAASRLEAIAAATGASESDVVRLADRLRALADELRRPPPQPDVVASQTSSSSTGEAGQADGGSGRPDIDLARRDEQIYEEQVVSASRFAQTTVSAPNSTTIVTRQDIRLSGLTSVPEMLRRAMGVEVMTLSPGDTEVSIRGLNQRASNKVLTFIDGRSVYLDFIGLTPWSALPITLEDIERIEIIRGPASAVYGADAFSGVVNIVMKEPGESRSFFSAGAGTGDHLRAAGSVSDRAGPLSYRLSVGLERQDQYTMDIDPERVDFAIVDEDPTLAQQRIWSRADTKLRLGEGYTLDAGTAFSLSAFSVYAIGRLGQQKTDNFWVGQTFAELETPVGLKTSVFWNLMLADVAVLESPVGGVPFEANDGVTHVVDVETSLTRDVHLGIDHHFIVGAGYRLKTVRFDWLDDEHVQHHFSLFAQDTMEVTNWLQGVVSLRLDRHPLLDGPQFSPRGAVLVLPTERSAIRATAGAAFRSPTFLESYLDVPVSAVPIRAVTTEARGDPNLSPERMVSFELGYDNQDSDYFAFETNAYFNILDDAILLTKVTPYTLGDYGADRVAYRNEVQGFPAAELAFENEGATFTQLGAEAGVRVFPISGLDLYANYAIHETDPLSDADLGGRENDQRTSRHKVNAGAQYRSSFGLDVSVDGHWLSRQVWVLQVTDLERGGIGFGEFVVPSYFLLNARLGYRMFEDRVELGVMGTNLIDPGHREHPLGQPRDRRFMTTITVRP